MKINRLKCYYEIAMIFWIDGINGLFYYALGCARDDEIEIENIKNLSKRMI